MADSTPDRAAPLGAVALDAASALRRATALATRQDARRGSRSRGSRAILGITGAPGAGKSTYAAGLVERLRTGGVTAALVPMDGFHLAYDVLVESGDVAVKGAPHTFDGAGFVALLRRLREDADEVVWAPRFDRNLEDPIAGSIPVGPEVSLVVTEGNYLLLEADPWSGVRDLLDECWFVDTPDDLRRTWLTDRHRSHGRPDEDAWARTLGSDEANARVVAATRARADVLVTPG